MSSVLIVAEHDGTSLNPSTARCVACAGEIPGADISIAVLGVEVAEVAAQASALNGVNTVIAADNAASQGFLAAALAPQVAQLGQEFDYILGPSTTYGKDLMPRVAALMGVAQVSDIMAVLGPRSFQRPVYAGNALITVEVPEGQKIVATVRTASYKAVSGGETCPVNTVSLDIDLPDHTRFVELKAASGDRPDLQTASVVISGGRGVGSAETFQILYELADSLGAGVGASRAAVDAGYVANDMQVGQTGKIIAPDLYMAFGISGAIQHLTGIKDAGTIVAVNKDSEAPIFEVADIGLVGDLFEVIPQLKSKLD